MHEIRNRVKSVVLSDDSSQENQGSGQLGGLCCTVELSWKEVCSCTAENRLSCMLAQNQSQMALPLCMGLGFGHPFALQRMDFQCLCSEVQIPIVAL